MAGEAGRAINCDGVQDSVFVNNLLYGNHASGISLYRIDGGSSRRTTASINNTIVMAADGQVGTEHRAGWYGQHCLEQHLAQSKSSRRKHQEYGRGNDQFSQRS